MCHYRANRDSTVPFPCTVVLPATVPGIGRFTTIIRHFLDLVTLVQSMTLTDSVGFLVNNNGQKETFPFFLQNNLSALISPQLKKNSSTRWCRSLQLQEPWNPQTANALRTKAVTWSFALTVPPISSVIGCVSVYLLAGFLCLPFGLSIEHQRRWIVQQNCENGGFESTHLLQ